MSLRTRLLSSIRRQIHVSTWEVPVTPGGTLKVRLPTTAIVKVRPLNPHESDWTQAKVDLHVLPSSDSHLTSDEAKQVADEVGLSVVSVSEHERSFILVEAPADSMPTAMARSLHAFRSWIGGPFRSHRALFDASILIDAQIPGKFDLDVEVKHGSVSLHEVFEGDVKVYVESADITIGKVKGMYVDIEAGDGDVSAGVIQGNLSARTETGNFDVQRVQGPSVKVTTGGGDLQMRALYAEYAMLRTDSGTVRLGGAQGYTKIRTLEGAVEICGVEGRLDVETDAGDVEASFSVPRRVTVRSRTGDIAMGLPADLNASMLCEGAQGVTIAENVGFRRDEEEGGLLRGIVSHPGGGSADDDAYIHARAPHGEVIVRQQSWGSSTNSSLDSFPRWRTND